MVNVVDKKELERIVGLARKYLEPYQPCDYRLEVDDTNVQKDGKWYFILVTPSKNNVSAADYSSRLARAEEELARDHEQEYEFLFVPVVRD